MTTSIRVPTHRPPTSPGEMLVQEFMRPLGLTQSELARRLGISFPRVNELIHGKRPVTRDTAVRLAALFGTTPDFWLNLQHVWDLYELAHSADMKRIARKIRPLKVAAGG